MQKPLADLIEARRRALGLTKAELAGAAALHPATIHRMLNGETGPRPTTLRKLAAALRIPLTDLTDQLELDSLTAGYDPGHPIETLLRDQIRRVGGSFRVCATEAALAAMLDTAMGLGRGYNTSRWKRLARREVTRLTVRECEALLIAQFQDLPRLLQRSAARAAIRAMARVEIRAGRAPSKDIFRASGSYHVQPLPTTRDPATAHQDRSTIDRRVP
jgi:transcriptional regulator with XRE-family HTH domain